MKLQQTYSSLTSSVEEIIQQTIQTNGHEDAFYVVDVQDILKKHKTWLINMPRVKPFYAIKCNTSPIVLELLASLGIGFDCASKVCFLKPVMLNLSCKSPYCFANRVNWTQFLTSE